MESDEVIKSSVKDHVPIPKSHFTTFSNPLFDSNDDFSSDDESLSEEEIQKDEFKYFSNPLYDLDDEIITNEKILPNQKDLDVIDSIFDEFSLPRPPEESNSEYSNATIESLSPSPIPVEDSDPFMEEIDIFLASDDSTPPGVESDYDSEGDILLLEELLNDDLVPLAEYNNFTFNVEPDTSVKNDFDELNEDECFDPGGCENVVFLNVEEDDSFTFTIRTFLPFVIYPEFAASLRLKTEVTAFKGEEVSRSNMLATILSRRGRQFWQTAALSIIEDGVMEITATVNGRVKTITEASIRRHLKLDDSDGISTLPTAETFEQLALMGFIQIFLNKYQRLLLPHKRTYPTPTLTQKLFSNMKRASKGYSGVNTPLFQTMLVQDQGEGLTIPVVSHHTPTSGPSTSQLPSTPPSIQTIHVAEEAALMPYDLPLLRVYSLGSDEGSLSLNELTVLCTSLSKKVESLESELKQTKQTYSTTLLKLIKRVKKLEQTIKTSQARRRAKVVISNAEEDEEDPSKQGDDQPKEQLGVFSAAKVLADAAEQRRDVENVQTYTRRRKAVSTSSGRVSTASELVSTGVKEKDKGKAIMQESEPPKKIKKRVQVQMSIDEELAQKVHEEEQARFNAEQEAKFKAEQEQERLDHETAMKIQEELDAAERKRMTQVHQAAQGFTDDEWDDILARVAA
ncbi:hypothetical protein Tco_1076629, partial [Tanacetum coccineum]